ncbi:trypsin-like serine protease with C-terminal PDZ domain [Sanguibacter keddieii DSM 10542]|uniref:Trypsin-like serine protease with C-terminal PDZ domain n=1 Tax=Sanguibacter keddieii (strain ATCC 51767 / DSM 10542 / NCFB 3025 / ST-74) TaxID=446469 RepID=D1BBC4_SANKS|nr:trypsin-like peptidase domain-containing protein [Sanguibacter keddieii]ACZ20690.1 trypsin-like serine protease with C-terminal PDZ domain [Sanguibacter keddieii DSM 10542]
MTSQNTPADDAARTQGAQPTEPVRPAEQTTRPLPPVPVAPTLAQPQAPTQPQQGGYRAQPTAYQPQQQGSTQHSPSAQHGAHGYAQQGYEQPGHQPQQQPFSSTSRQEPQQGTTTVAAAPKRRLVLPIATTAVLAAVLASVGTAALTGQIGSDSAAGTTSSTGYSSIGKQSGSSGAVPVAESTDGSADWKAVSAAVAPSVVAIKVTTQQGEGEGSGVVIDDQGHILTNDHVVSGAVDDTVKVTLSDGRVYEAKIVGLDPATDLAVVKLVDPPEDLQPAVLADSSQVNVGDAVMAVGNPLGLSNTATTGIVSALDRPVSTATSDSNQTAVVTNAIQIDAAINPGNSGGPLFNAKGEVIGITSSIAALPSSGASSQSGSIGLGFAIPSNLVQNIGGQLIEKGKAEHAFLGVTLADGEATADGTTRQGAVVRVVTDGSPAAAAGLQPDDVVVAIDGKSVTGLQSLTGFVRALTTGTEVTLTVVRDGKALDVPVTLATRTEEATSNDEDPGSTDGTAPDQGTFPGQGDQPGEATQPGSESPNNVPDLSDLFPGQNG